MYFHLRSSPLSNQNWVRHNIHLELSADSSTGATSHSAAATSFPDVFAKVKLNLINDHEVAMVDIAVRHFLTLVGIAIEALFWSS